MKKAVIQTGGRQYLVTEGQELEVDFIKGGKKTLSFTPLLVIDDKKVSVGTPELSKNSVKVDVLETEKQGDKVTSIRYKAKKRIRTVRGHRQKLSVLKISKIS